MMFIRTFHCVTAHVKYGVDGCWTPHCHAKVDWSNEYYPSHSSHVLWVEDKRTVVRHTK
jgi:hypothetical protein